MRYWLWRRSRLTQTLDDRGVGHAAALAHRLQPVPPATLLEGVDQCGHDASAAGAQRVADGDGAAVDIGLTEIRAGVGSPGKCRVEGAKFLVDAVIYMLKANRG